MIFRTAIINGSNIDFMDTLEHEGQFWLVPDWSIAPDEQYISPLRMVAMRTIRHHDLGEPKVGEARFVVTMPIPQCVFRGVAPLGQEKLFEIWESPEIWIANPEANSVSGSFK